MDKVIKLLIDNIGKHDYRENVEEILTKYFKQNPVALQEWQEWFQKEQVS